MEREQQNDFTFYEKRTAMAWSYRELLSCQWTKEKINSKCWGSGSAAEAARGGQSQRRRAASPSAGVLGDEASLRASTQHAPAMPGAGTQQASSQRTHGRLALPEDPFPVCRAGLPALSCTCRVHEPASQPSVWRHPLKVTGTRWS